MKRKPENGPMDDLIEVAAFDNLSKNYLGVVERSLVRRAVCFAGLLKYDKAPLIIDVGAGPANIPIKIAHKAPESVVVALDLSLPMLFKAKDNIREAGLEGKVIPVCASSENLPFKDNTFDFSYTNFTLHHLPDPTRSIAEVVRVADFGKRFIIRDLRRPPRWLIPFYMKVFGASYDSEMKKMYLESLEAGFSFREMRLLSKTINCLKLRVRRIFITYFSIEGEK